MSAAHQMGLLDWTPPTPAPGASEQAQQLVRVEGRIAKAVIAWCSRHVGAEFHLSALTADVMAEVLCAPDSPRRILGQLRATGQVQVAQLDRARSIYRVEGVSP